MTIEMCVLLVNLIKGFHSEVMWLVHVNKNIYFWDFMWNAFYGPHNPVNIADTDQYRADAFRWSKQ